MSPERFQRVREIYHGAMACPADQRDAFLGEACSRDSALRHEVESLLAAEAGAGRFLASTAETGSDPQWLRSRAPSLAGRTLGNYEVLSRLAAGGMGEVYLARDTRLGRQVAIKLLPSVDQLNSERVRRFEREARSASALNHPNIITIYDIGTCDAGRYIVMELVEGLTLREILEGGPALASVAPIGGQIARSLAVAHAAGIIHRDIKPANIIVRKDGYVKVLDFGLARLANEVEEARSLDVTNPGQVLGTAAYMSPEQARGENAGAPSDVFSLGIIYYEMATGKHPFQGGSLIATLHAIHSQPPIPPATLNPQIPAQLEDLILTMLHKDPSRRPTAAQVDEALSGASQARQGIPLEPGAQRLHNLPLQRTPLIGRRAERSAL
jgi:eukaryotic-like serine/threonine-protein kinase